MALTIEQWQEVRDVLVEVEANLQDDGTSQATASQVIKEVRDALKPMVYTEEYRKTLIAYVKQADAFGLNIEADEDDGQLVIYTGLVYPEIDPSQKDEIQTFNDLQLMDEEE